MSKRLTPLWIIWAILLVDQVAFFTLLLAYLLPHRQQPPTPQARIMWVNLAMLVIVVPVAYFVRRTIFISIKRSATVSTWPYYVGHITFWIACLSLTFASLMIVLVTGVRFPGVALAAVTLALQLATFPRAGAVAFD